MTAADALFLLTMGLIIVGLATIGRLAFHDNGDSQR